MFINALNNVLQKYIICLLSPNIIWMKYILYYIFNI